MKRADRARALWGSVLLFIGSVNLINGVVSGNWVSLAVGVVLVVLAVRRFEEAGL